MSVLVVKSILLLNTTLSTNTIASITTTTATRTFTATAAANISGHMREDAMDVVVAKILSLLILTILSVLCGLLPLRLLVHTPHLFNHSRSSVDYVLCCLRLFSGGIYLATCFLHLMPDTREKMSAVMLNLGSRTTFAVPELLIMSGFFAVVFVEQIIQVLYVKAQGSDVKRVNYMRPRKTKAKADNETARDMQVFQSTLDGDRSGDIKDSSDDEDDDEEYNNVLVDDEEDLSFKETDFDGKSLDSMTQVKENLIEPLTNSEILVNNNSLQHIQLIPNHCNNISTKVHVSQQNLIKHSISTSHSDLENHVLNCIPICPLDTLSKSSTSEIIPYKNLGPAVIPTQIQTHCILNSFKKSNYVPKLQSNHILNHITQQNQQPNKQYQDQQTNSCSSFSTSLQPSVHQMQHVHKTAQNPSPKCSSPIPQTDLHYPSVTQSSSDESTEEEDEEGDTHNNSCRVSVYVEGANGPIGGCTSRQPGDCCQDNDVDPGMLPIRNDCEAGESRMYTQTLSRDASLDRISETSSVLQDIQVKQVVDELSRTSDTRAHFRSIIYILALSFHGIFEGMALGLQSMKSSTWSLCFAIVIHRCVLAFKLGMYLCRCEEKQGTTFLCIGMFTVISALGIIVGILISSGASFYSDVTVPEAILQSLATGTIFYIVFFDILFKDLEGKEYLKRVSCSFVGFSLMAVVFAVTRS